MAIAVSYGLVLPTLATISWSRASDVGPSAPSGSVSRP